MLGAGAGFDEVEVALGGGVDEDVFFVFEEFGWVEVLAGAAELGGEVVEGCSGGGGRGVEVGATEAVEGMDVVMGFHQIDGMLGEEGIAVVGKGVWMVLRKIRDLMVRDDDFRWGDAGEFVEELGGV